MHWRGLGFKALAVAPVLPLVRRLAQRLGAYWRGDETVMFSLCSADEFAMPSLLERYVAGDHEAVWADLTALGTAVGEEAYEADAIAVAEETMKRARHNAELIITRLDKLGYQFYTQRNVHAELMQQFSQAAALMESMNSAGLSFVGAPDPQFPGFPDRWPLTANTPNPNAMLPSLGAMMEGNTPTAEEMLGGLQPFFQQMASLSGSMAASQLKPSSTVAADIVDYEATHWR